MGGHDGPVSESARYRPPSALRPYVGWYAGYRQAGVAPARHRGLPSPYLTLIVTLDEPLHVAAHPDPRQAASRHEVLVGGLHTTPALVTHDGSQSGIQLGVTPRGARALLGLPAGELAGIDLEGPTSSARSRTSWPDGSGPRRPGRAGSRPSTRR